jgi:DNA repair exonuclease SbcCD ATPase subunit
MTDTNAGPVFTASLYGSVEVAREAEVNWLRQRIAELEREIKSHRVRAQQDAESWQIALSELDARGSELDRLRAEKAHLIEDRARFPDKPDDVGHMISAHIENLKRRAESAEGKCEALKPDAERYRWLRCRDKGPSCFHNAVVSSYINGQPDYYCEDELDAAIDAARAAREGRLND